MSLGVAILIVGIICGIIGALGFWLKSKASYRNSGAWIGGELLMNFAIGAFIVGAAVLLIGSMLAGWFK